MSIIRQQENRDRVVSENLAGDLRRTLEHLAQIENAGKWREHLVNDGKPAQAGQFGFWLFPSHSNLGAHDRHSVA